MNLAPYIDHTILKPDSTEEQVLLLCEEASQFGFASVCILPWHVQAAARALHGTTVPVCTVVGFPLGASVTSIKVAETQQAIRDGAREIDMVISMTALKSGDHDAVAADIAAVTYAAHEHGALVKVIIEACLLTNDEKRRLCTMVTEAGAEYIKTSTGFSTGGATLEDVALLRAHVGPHVKVKASGGIRDRATAEAMIAAGAERLGTSSGITIVSA